MPVGARRRWIGAAGIRGQRLESVERRHAGDCMSASYAYPKIWTEACEREQTEKA
jgi:hypothetical protein